MRERLIKLLKQAEKQQSLNAVCGDIDSLIDSPRGAEFIADYLLENGVVLLPCKVGQTVYVVDKRLNVWWQGEVDCVYCNKNSFEYGILFDNDEYGAYNEEDVFFTKEEAEAKLKGETK